VRNSGRTGRKNPRCEETLYSSHRLPSLTTLPRLTYTKHTASPRSGGFSSSRDSLQKRAHSQSRRGK
jgi:hypothetical protein